MKLRSRRPLSDSGDSTPGRTTPDPETHDAGGGSAGSDGGQPASQAELDELRSGIAMLRRERDAAHATPGGAAGGSVPGGPAPAPASGPLGSAHASLGPTGAGVLGASGQFGHLGPWSGGVSNLYGAHSNGSFGVGGAAAGGGIHPGGLHMAAPGYYGLPGAPHAGHYGTSGAPHAAAPPNLGAPFAGVGGGLTAAAVDEKLLHKTLAERRLKTWNSEPSRKQFCVFGTFPGDLTKETMANMVYNLNNLNPTLRGPPGMESHDMEESGDRHVVAFHPRGSAQGTRKYAPEEDVRSLVEKLLHLSKVVRVGKYFVRRMLNSLGLLPKRVWGAAETRMRLGPEFHADVALWRLLVAGDLGVSEDHGDGNRVNAKAWRAPP
eukprot:g15045.t1